MFLICFNAAHVLNIEFGTSQNSYFLLNSWINSWINMSWLILWTKTTDWGEYKFEFSVHAFFDFFLLLANSMCPLKHEFIYRLRMARKIRKWFQQCSQLTNSGKCSSLNSYSQAFLRVPLYEFAQQALRMIR